MEFREYLKKAKDIEKNVPTTESFSAGYAMLWKGFPTLAVRVKGLLHKGWVYIQRDLENERYDVLLLDAKSKAIKEDIENIEEAMLSSTLLQLVG